MIISASRRTDLPTYYSEWFLNRLKEGYVLTRNPLNHSQVSRISLSPELIDCIVFWTKDPLNILDKLQIIDKLGYPYYFQFTLTPYGKDIECNLREKEDIITTFQQLSLKIGKDRVIWRYDPILLNDIITIQYHLDCFKLLCQRLNGFTESCTISFIDVYKKLNRKVKENIVHEMQEEQIHQIAAAFSTIGRSYGIQLTACCERIDLTRYGIMPAACIDKKLVERICGHPINGKKDKNQRQECGCAQSIDIGAYNTCRNGCVYCYANHSSPSIQNNCQKHDPQAAIILGAVEQNEIMKDRSL